jgi:hypothetical protein
MAKDLGPIVVICGACGARYSALVNWLESAAEFHCSCGAHLKADTDDLFQVRHHMMARPQITLQSLQE